MCVPAVSHRITFQVAHQDAQGDHFPEPGTADVCQYGARLACTPSVHVLTGPVIGEVTANSAVSAPMLTFFTCCGYLARLTAWMIVVDSITRYIDSGAHTDHILAPRVHAQQHRPPKVHLYSKTYSYTRCIFLTALLRP